MNLRIIWLWSSLNMNKNKKVKVTRKTGNDASYLCISLHVESRDTPAVAQHTVETMWGRLRIEPTYSPEMSSSYKSNHNIEASCSRWPSRHISRIDFLTSSSGYIHGNTQKSLWSAPAETLAAGAQSKSKHTLYIYQCTRAGNCVS